MCAPHRCHMPDGEAGPGSAFANPDDDAGKDLGALLVAFFGLDTHLHPVAGVDLRVLGLALCFQHPTDILAQLNPFLAFILSASSLSSLDKLALAKRSGRRSRVRSTACSH